MTLLRALGATLALVFAWPSAALADGGPASYRWVAVCDGTFGPIDRASPPTLTYDQHGVLCTVGGGGSGGGGAATIADGADVTQGAKADAVAAAGAGSWTNNSLLKGILSVLANNIYTPGAAGTPSSQVMTMQGIAGMVPIQAVLAAGSAILGKVGIDQTTPGTTNGVAIVGVNAATALAGNGVTGPGSPRVTVASDNTPFAVNAQPAPVTSGGVSVFFLQPTASDNHTVIKNGAGQVYKIVATNVSAIPNYVRLYNAGTGFNGCNSASNLVYQAAIPASTSASGLADSWDLGMAGFATGISVCVTSGYPATDVTNATPSAISLNIGYK